MPVTMNPVAEMEDGQIDPGTARGDVLGFSADIFVGWLWKRGDVICISFIEVLEPGQGHFKALVNRILAAGCEVQIPTPLGRMQAIVRRWGFEQTHVIDPVMGRVEVWCKRGQA